jgi:hypothetical protein
MQNRYRYRTVSDVSGQPSFAASSSMCRKQTASNQPVYVWSVSIIVRICQAREGKVGEARSDLEGRRYLFQTKSAPKSYVRMARHPRNLSLRYPLVLVTTRPRLSTPRVFCSKARKKRAGCLLSPGASLAECSLGTSRWSSRKRSRTGSPP